MQEKQQKPEEQNSKNKKICTTKQEIKTKNSKIAKTVMNYKLLNNKLKATCEQIKTNMKRCTKNRAESILKTENKTS
jgi:hypothetical protein